MTHLRVRAYNQAQRAFSVMVVGYMPSNLMVDPDFDAAANDHEPSCEGLDHLLHHYRAGHDNLTS